MKKELNRILLLCTLLVICTNNLLAQSIGAPKFVNNFGDLEEVCGDFDRIFDARAILFSGAVPLPNGNEYILELSDETGNFDNPVEIGRVEGPNNASNINQDIDFTNIKIPEGTVGGDSYRIRVTTSLTTIESDPSDPLPVYFFRNDIKLGINEFRDITLCNVTSFSKDLTVVITDKFDDSIIIDTADFEFQWFKGEIPGGIEIPGITGPTLTVTQNDLDASGVAAFYAQINFGQCNALFSSDARSNTIRVRLIEVADVFIEDGPTFNFCPGDNATLQSSITDTKIDYQWLKDDVVLEGAILPSYDLPNDNFQGEYVLQVTYSQDCQILTNPVIVENDGSSITVPLIDNLVILPNETISLEITTDAPLNTSTYELFRNGSPIIGISPLTDPVVSWDITNPGEYLINIDADDICNSSLTSMTNVYVPIGIGLTITQSEGNDCDNDTVSIELEEMTGFTLPSSGGPPQIPLLESQWTFFDFEWFKDGVSTGITTTTIDIDISEDDATYELRANLKTGEFTDIVSDPLEIVLVPSDIVIQASNLVLEEAGSVTLTVPQSDTFTYQWYQKVEGEDVIIEGQITNTLEVTQSGIYFVIISSDICEVIIPEINIGGVVGETEIIPNIITLNNDGINDNWLLPDSLFNQEEVEVTIYNIRGQVDFSSTSYQNNWPLENSRSQGLDPIYYFIITKNNSVVRKGSITVMR